ncbi:UNVERIFIED_CONTAM: hypothetical protein FKN15_054574 [Acipenser sinensis]
MNMNRLSLFLGAAPELSVQAQNILRRSSAKPADWKYQTGLSASWPVLECNVEVDLQIPVPADSANRELDKCARTEEYPLPKRVFAPLAGTGVTICDYMFKDEAPKDIQFRIKELLDLDVKADQLDMLLEMDSDIVVAEPETSQLLGIVFPDDYNSMQLKVGKLKVIGKGI